MKGPHISTIGVQACTLPNLPGYRGFFIEEHQRPLPQLFRVCNGIPVVLDQAAPADQQMSPTSHQPLSEVAPSNITRVQQDTQPCATPALPSWLAYDRMVLRFYAYVKEPLLGVAPEAHRIRRCVILHYLEDATLAINEPRQPSSDTPYGPILKRHKSDIRLESLRVGKSVTLFSRIYNIISADAFTGRFMESHGLPLDADIAAPEDPQERRERERRAVQHTRKAQRPRPLIDKDAFDAMQFFKNDRKVLRFHCYWDDRMALYGDMRLFRLYYYLSDDTVEVVEVLRRNCGRDPFPHMLRRMRVPKCPEPVGGCPPSAGSSIKPPEAFYRWHELHIGSHVEVFGRKLMVYDCDAFTRHWMKERLQIADDALKPILVPSLQPKFYSREVPSDALGIGSEEDSLQNVLRLLPKAPKKDFNRLMLNDGKVLRFSAVLHPRPGSCPADAAIDRERSFVVSFFLADNKLSIFEHAQPNSGFQGGRFLERRRIMNPEASTFYEPQDMRVGSTIHTAGRALVLIGADEYTRNYMESAAALRGKQLSKASVA